MTTLVLKKIDEVYFKVIAERHVLQELHTYFSYDDPNAAFSKWKGKRSVFNLTTKQIFIGNFRYIQEFCNDVGYELVCDFDPASSEFSVKEAKDFIKTLNLPDKIKSREYQETAFIHAIRERRSLLLSPTSSGKSFIIYLLMRYYHVRTLIIVPTINLVDQLASDFIDYGFESSRFIHRIYAGEDKNTKKPITISTWQSIYEQPQEYFEKFDLVIGDEVHLFTAKSLKSIMTKLINCKYRFGLTGTLDGLEIHKLILEGMFGPVRKIISTSEMIQQGYASKLSIKAITLSYPMEVRKRLSGYNKDYQTELSYIMSNKRRNKFITNLALSLKGNTMLLFQRVDDHGKILYELIKQGTDRPVYFIHGKVEKDDREEIRKIMEIEDNAIIVASYGTFSTGVNIVNLHNLIFASPSKGRIRNLQSIGRILRKSDSKTHATLYDISDDFSYNGNINYTLEHFVIRVKIYNEEEEFKLKFYNVSLYDNQ